MSAITGIFMRNGKDVDPELMKKMNDKLAHRGPDGSDIWYEGPIGLGHQMLWTTQESLHEKLPFEENGLIITADARIDNRDELSKELGLKDEEDVSDSYFILKAYEMWGEDCPDKLLGDFAFAIWDKAQEKLFCARDHMGVKPFYYYLDDDMFVFGTEIKALFEVERVSREINDLKILSHILNIRDKKYTFYKNIFCLAAAHNISLNKKFKINQFWKLNPKSNITMDSDEEYANAFLEIFKKAVHCRLRSAFPIGFELSGGLDSSSVTCMAQKIYENEGITNQINTFSFVFDNFPSCDERYYIKKVTSRYGFKYNYIKGDKITPLENIKDIIFYQEQPFITPHMSIIWNLYQNMYSKDIRILLSGSDGDTIVSYGQKHLKDLFLSFKWNKLLKELYCNKNSELSLFDIVKKEIIFPLVPEFIKNNLVPVENKTPIISILNDDFADKVEADDFLMKYFWKPKNKANTSKKYHYYLIDHYSHQYILEMMNKTSSAFFIEPRYPFYDKRLVEFCYALPTEMKLKFGWSRYILRIAMENILPKDIQWRSSKADLNPVYQNNLLLEKEYLEELISDPNSLMTKYLDMNKVKNIYEKYSTEKYSHSRDIWYLTILYYWLDIQNKNILDS